MAVLNNSPVLEEVLPSANLITITQDAAYKIQQLIEEEGNLGLKLRVFITGGGCSGFQYGFTFDEAVNVDDTVITGTLDKSADNVQHEEISCTTVTVQLLIDPLSRMYLVGAEIDYKADLSGERFIIRNPNAKTTCGCGASFSA